MYLPDMDIQLDPRKQSVLLRVKAYLFYKIEVN